MNAEPGEVTVEVFAVLWRLEVAVGNAPVGNRAGHPVNQLLDRVLALGCVDFTVEVLADDNIGRQLAPGSRNLAGRLLKQQLAVLAFDRCCAELPFGRVERTVHLDRAEGGLDGEWLPGRGGR